MRHLPRDYAGPGAEAEGEQPAVRRAEHEPVVGAMGQVRRMLESNAPLLPGLLPAASGNAAIGRAIQHSADTDVPADFRPAPAGGTAIFGKARQMLEAGTGTPLHDVRIHTDNQAAAQAEQLNARAFTVGQDVYFGAGQYRPDTSDGFQLLAHEVVHTLQNQDTGPVARSGLTVSSPRSPAEREAEALAEQLAGGHQVTVRGEPGAVVRREPTTGTADMHSALEQQYAAEHGGSPPPGGVYGAAYQNWLAQPMYTAAVARLQAQDPVMHRYLAPGQVGRTMRVRTFPVPVTGGGANSPNTLEFQFDLVPTLMPAGQNHALALFVDVEPTATMSAPVATVNLRMELRFSIPNDPDPSIRLAEFLYHEGIHLLVKMDRVVEKFAPGLTAQQSGQAASAQTYRTLVRNRTEHAALQADLELAIGRHYARANVTTSPNQAATNVINRVIDERFAYDRQRQHFPGPPIHNQAIARDYIPNELRNESIIESDQTILARLIQKMTAVLDLIPTPSP